MKAWLSSWHPPLYKGECRCLVVAKTEKKAKKIWNDFLENNIGIKLEYDRASTMDSGYTIWEESDLSMHPFYPLFDISEGCYMLRFKRWENTDKNN